MDDVDAVVQLLPLEEWVEVVEEVEEVLLPVAVGDEDSHALRGIAVGWLILASCHGLVLPLHFLECQGGLE